ncbi:MAG: prolipoprotein diacylglyceryl transferase [Pseudomonadales bacterium]|jgi:phosphatidylglycerol---prolipoprotein diacylglyceryl transferase|nr:prolipoprotein diacylglyceryl transferase [Pseudomonadales bacterium]MDP4641115.1 prolipoprotein diacylglyceryl transferase [Pseudomonadales bacterium]MDP4766094.1 prolipoprotein diacylglyceryl transferase [Pseudomonadales bacterium]MDP4875081.1 prolipoprotein diacylglyceryl transferase [Pseudomonadales bacterium]MDP4910733.1 prolipoprotein diacylglyceryl transferase [Pseudomonadales bacterium]
MWHYPEFDPVLVSIGPLSIHWYALSYLVGISLVWWSLGRRAKARGLAWNDEQISDMIFYGMLGVILGGRIGYVVFYGWQNLVQDPLSLFRVWEGGMSFHGGMLGVLFAMYLYGRRLGRGFFAVTDFIAPSVPIALGCGRIGNFINGELPGRVTDMPWAAIYPGEVVGRHPSSLYQAFAEGVVLFAVLWLFSRRPRPPVTTSGMFLIAYGLLRLTTEFFRTPDSQLMFVAFDWMTMGQLLSLPMVVLGLGFIYYGYQQAPVVTTTATKTKTSKKPKKPKRDAQH